MNHRFALGAIACLAFALVACGPSEPANPTGGSSTAPSVAPSAPGPSNGSGLAACTRDSVRATTAGWTGGAGSRGAEILVEVVGPDACRLPAGAAVALLDAAGTVAASSADPAAGEGLAIDPGDARSFFVEVANWCDPDPRLPFQPVVALEGDVAVVEGGALATADDLPPCNAPGSPPEVTVSGW